MDKKGVNSAILWQGWSPGVRLGVHGSQDPSPSTAFVRLRCLLEHPEAAVSATVRLTQSQPSIHIHLCYASASSAPSPRLLLVLCCLLLLFFFLDVEETKKK